jgi:hypothetical protein
MSKEFKEKDVKSKKKFSNKKTSSNGRKGKFQGKDEAKVDDYKSKPGDINDASVYYSNPELLSQVTNISFNEYLGVPVDLENQFTLAKREYVSNVTTFFMNPSVQPTGYQDSARYSSINTVAYKNYLLLSANNAKVTSYAPQDVTCLILAIGQVLAIYSYLKRPFGCIYLINQRNRSYPELLFKAMGIDYADFRSNVADYRIKFNELIAMFDKIPFFSEIPYFKKCMNMYSDIYIDEDTPLAQSYLFVPQSTWQINEAYNPNGTGLDTVWVVNKGTTRTFDELLGIFADMINALSTSTTFNAIFSDVLRVVSNGKGSTLLMELVSEAYTVTPVINAEIRHWINNAKFLHTPDDKDAFPGSIGIGATNSNDVASDASTNSILYNPIFSVFGGDHDAQTKSDDPIWKAIASSYESDLINFDAMAPSIEDKVAATRLAVRGSIEMVEAPLEGQYFYVLRNIGLGDYYCSGVVIYDDVVTAPITVNENYTDGWNVTLVKIFDHFDKLKYAPRHTVYHNVPSNYVAGVSGDLTYYTTLNFAYMKRLKDVEALTEFAVNI